MAYETGFSHVSEAELYGMMRAVHWEKHTPEIRLALYQEVENRQAKKQGRAALKVVTFEDDSVQDRCYGYFSESHRDYLYINQRYVDGKISYMGARKNMDELLPAVDGLKTILHVGRHYYQYLVVNYDSYAPYMDTNMRKAWMMSWHEYSRHICNLGSTNDYLDKPIGHVFANFECECDARRYTEGEMVRIAAMFREKFGDVDLDFERAIYEMRLFEHTINGISDSHLDDTLNLMNGYDEHTRGFYYSDGNNNPFLDRDMSGISMFATYRKELKKRLAARKEGDEHIDQPDSVDALLDRMKAAAGKEKVDRVQSVKIDAKRGI